MAKAVQYHLDKLNASTYEQKRGSKQAVAQVNRQLLWLASHNVALRMVRGRYVFL